MRRANGLAKTRSPLTWAGTGCAAGAGGGSVFGLTPAGGAAGVSARCPLPDGAAPANFSRDDGSSPSSSSKGDRRMHLDALGAFRDK